MLLLNQFFDGIFFKYGIEEMLLADRQNTLALTYSIFLITICKWHHFNSICEEGAIKKSVQQ